jgi:hypothetical protein
VFHHQELLPTMLNRDTIVIPSGGANFDVDQHIEEGTTISENYTTSSSQIVLLKYDIFFFTYLLINLHCLFIFS